MIIIITIIIMIYYYYFIIITKISAVCFVQQKRWFLVIINTLYCAELKMSMSRNPKYIIYF